MSDRRQKNQLVLAFTEEGGGKLEGFSGRDRIAHGERRNERPASHEQWMEEVCERKTAGRLTSESKRTKEVRESTA